MAGVDASGAHHHTLAAEHTGLQFVDIIFLISALQAEKYLAKAKLGEYPCRAAGSARAAAYAFISVRLKFVQRLVPGIVEVLDLESVALAQRKTEIYHFERYLWT